MSAPFAQVREEYDDTQDLKQQAADYLLLARQYEECRMTSWAENCRLRAQRIIQTLAAREIMAGVDK